MTRATRIVLILEAFAVLTTAALVFDPTTLTNHRDPTYTVAANAVWYKPWTWLEPVPKRKWVKTSSPA